jgi:hypothetical protein
MPGGFLKSKGIAGDIFDLALQMNFIYIIEICK